MRRILFIGLLTTIYLCGKSQERTFNEEKGFLSNTQFMGLIDNTCFSQNIGYKNGKVVYIIGYNRNYYSLWTLHGFKGGIHVYPHRNLKKVKIFYQTFLSYKWNPASELPIYYSLQVGSGFDYFFKKNISIGYDLSIGSGPMKEFENLGYGNMLEYSSMISFKYLFTKK